jgi:hypothetical protein
MERGISFAEIFNLDLIGEDRHFCIRAAALGLELYADTCYPPYHIYRESELQGLARHKELYDYAQRQPTPKLTLAMLVRNEANRYLTQVLTHASQYIDEAVILDDASEDDTVAVCQQCLKNVPTAIYSNKKAGFHNEITLRKQLWTLTLDTKPDWILMLDADEIFEDRMIETVPHLLRNPLVDVYYFRLYDMWSSTQYREDGYWQAHRHYRPFLLRYRKDINYVWQETPQHCGRLPINVTELPGLRCSLRIRHLGWSKAEDRLQKYYRYKQLDPQGQYGIREQYLSILDPKPNLIPWMETE